MSKVLITEHNCLELFREHAEMLDQYAQKELRDKNLVCWCKPNDPCHADIWLEIANR